MTSMRVKYATYAVAFNSFSICEVRIILLIFLRRRIFRSFSALNSISRLGFVVLITFPNLNVDIKSRKKDPRKTYAFAIFAGPKYSSPV